VLVAGVLLFALRDTPNVSSDAQTTPNSLNSRLEPIRRNYDLPALAAAIVGMAPAKGFAAPVMTNQAGGETCNACDTAASAPILHFV